MAKSKAIEDMLTAIFPARAIPGICALCDSAYVAPGDFRDDLSRREFTISKMCQKCQDAVFDDGEGDMDDDDR